MIYLKNNNDIIESYYILFKDKDLSKKFKFSDYKENKNFKICSKVLEACCSGYVIQKQGIINLSFFDSQQEQNIVNDIINSNLENKNKIYLLNSCINFKDFSFFIELVNSKIEFIKYNDYEISELLAIKELCKKNKINSDANYILDNMTNAENNAKVLKMVNKINSFDVK